MAQNLVVTLIENAINSNATYAEFIVSEGNLAFISDSGKRRSTKNSRLDDKGTKLVESTLKQFDEKSLLFSGSLNRIRVVLCDGREAEYVRNISDNSVRIKGKNVFEKNIKEFHWVRFTDETDGKYGVAFEVKVVNGKNRIQACKGSIQSGVFNSGISTDLSFVISGEFGINKQSDNIEFNEKMIQSARKVGSILEYAICNMIHLGLLNMSFYSVLPSTIDEDNEINNELISSVKGIFEKRPLFRNGSGLIVNKSRIILGTKEVTRLFPQNLIDRLFYEKYWIEACDEGSREEYFLIDVGVPYYDREKFLWNLFVDDNLDELSDILASQKDKWLREFYIFCSSPVSEDKVGRRIISALCNTKSIRDSKGKMRFPYELSLLSKGDSINTKTAVVKNSLIYPGDKVDDYSDQILKFFTESLKIGGFSYKNEMVNLADDLMNKKQPIDQLYCDRLVKLAKYDMDNPGEIDFSGYSIFPYETSRGIKRATANKLVIGKPFVKEGNLIVSAMNRDSLWKGIIKFLSEEDLSFVIDFAIRYGAVGKAVIIQQKADQHIDFEKSLFIQGKQGNRDTNYDYIIPGLDEMLRRRSIQLSKMVWLAILEEKSTEVLYAEYSVDNRSVVNRDDSSLIKILRERTWVPGKDGKFYMPENITYNDISDDFSVNKRNPILKYLHFGEGIKEKEKNISNMRKLAEKEGLRLISEEEYQEFIKWKNSKGSKRK